MNSEHFWFDSVSHCENKNNKLTMKVDHPIFSQTFYKTCWFAKKEQQKT